MLFLCDSQIDPKLDHGSNQLVPVCRHQLRGILSYLGDIVPNVQICNVGNFHQCLNGILLYLLIIDLNSCKDALHDEISLSFQLEILGCLSDGSTQSLHCNLGGLCLLTIDVANGGMQDLANLLI